MSMGYGANFAEVIEEKNVEKIVGNDGKGKSLVAKLKKMMGNIFECEYEAVDYLMDNPPCGDYDEAKAEKFAELYRTIVEKFKSETGLELELMYHDQDNDGDRYDGVDGLYWEVFGCYVPSPSLLKLREKFGDDVIERKFFVTYG